MTNVGDIMIHQPWGRASLGNAPNIAAYMTLETMGAEADGGSAGPVQGRRKSSSTPTS